MNKNQLNLLILCVMGAMIAQNLKLSLALPICGGYVAFLAATFVIPRAAWDRLTAENDGVVTSPPGPMWKRSTFWLKAYAFSCIAYTLCASWLFAITFMK